MRRRQAQPELLGAYKQQHLTVRRTQQGREGDEGCMRSDIAWGWGVGVRWRRDEGGGEFQMEQVEDAS